MNWIRKIGLAMIPSSAVLKIAKRYVSEFGDSFFAIHAHLPIWDEAWLNPSKQHLYFYCKTCIDRLAKDGNHELHDSIAYLGNRLKYFHYIKPKDRFDVEEINEGGRFERFHGDPADWEPCTTDDDLRDRALFLQMTAKYPKNLQ